MVECKFNTSGTLCGVCEEGFHHQHASDPCVACDDAGFAKRQAPLLVVLGLFVVLVIGYLCFRWAQPSEYARSVEYTDSSDATTYTESTDSTEADQE